MGKMIAVRRRFDVGSGLPADLSGTRMALATAARTRPSSHAPRLTELGFSAVAPPSAEGPSTMPANPVSLGVAPDHSTFCRLEYLGGYVLQAPDEKRLAAAAERLEDDYVVVPDIALSLPRPVGLAKVPLSAAAVSRVQRSWHERSGVPDAHGKGNFGTGVVVGVIDTGCDADHAEFHSRTVEFAAVPMFPDQPLRIVRGYDPHGHGTHVCGIVAGASVGIAPQVDLLVANVIESETVGTSLERVMRGLDWMLRRLTSADHVNKPAVVNLSLGFAPDIIAPQHLANVMLLIRQILIGLTRVGVLAVVAIGNDGPGLVRAPGYFPESLAVGAVDWDMVPAEFSGGGPAPAPFEARVCPDVAGFGVDVLSSLERRPDGSSWYLNDQGTSMAAPYVTGVAALVASATGLRGAALRDHLLGSVVELPAEPDRVGRGLVRYSVP